MNLAKFIEQYTVPLVQAQRLDAFNRVGTAGFDDTPILRGVMEDFAFTRPPFLALVEAQRDDMLAELAAKEES